MLVQAPASGGKEEAPATPSYPWESRGGQKGDKAAARDGSVGATPCADSSVLRCSVAPGQNSAPGRQHQSAQQKPAAPAPDVAAPALPAEAPNAVHHQPHPPPLLGSRRQVSHPEQQGRPQGRGRQRLPPQGLGPQGPAQTRAHGPVTRAAPPWLRPQALQRH